MGISPSTSWLEDWDEVWLVEVLERGSSAPTRTLVGDHPQDIADFETWVPFAEQRGLVTRSAGMIELTRLGEARARAALARDQFEIGLPVRSSRMLRFARWLREWRRR
jgi:hypothetical protein